MKATEPVFNSPPRLSMKIRGIILRGIFSSLLGLVMTTVILTPTLHAQATPQPTFKAGDVPIFVKGSFETEYNDNINYSNDNRASDIILRPAVIVAINYNLTAINTVALQ